VRRRTTVDISDVRIQSALVELQEMIRSHYPAAKFVVDEGDDPDGVYLTATVDLDDPDEVMDVIVDRLLEIEIDEGLPIYVIPSRTPERIAEHLRVLLTELQPDVMPHPAHE
jgi:hypothetical protein